MTRRVPGIGGVCALMLLSVAWLGGQATVPPARGGRPTDTLLVTLAGAQQRAAALNPGYLAAREEVAVARGAARQAGLLPYNPEISLALPGLLAGDRTGYEVALTQELEIAGQGRLRRQAARLGVDRARASVANAARLIVAEASTAWYRAYAAGQRLALADRAMVLQDRLNSAVRLQVREGEISQLEANLAEIETGRARGRLLAARREAEAAELTLKRVLTLSPTQPLRFPDLASLPPLPPPSTVSAEALVVQAMGRRADRAAGAIALDEVETRRTLLRRETLPNLQASLMSRREPGESQRYLGVGVGLSIPLFNRNQGALAQYDALVRQARYARTELESQVETEVLLAVEAYRMATEEVAVFVKAVLEPAQKNTGLLETAFQEGKLALPTLLLLRKELLNAEQEYWTAWLAQREALVALEAALQTQILPDPEPEGSEDTPRHIPTPGDSL